MEIKGITIHNTGNDLSAKDVYDVFAKDMTMNLCHYLVDDEGVIEVLSEQYEASHTGKGYDFGNKYTIAIEICQSTSDEKIYLKAQNRAIKLIKKLMKKYKLSKDDLYFHNDFNIKARCPHRILEKYTKEGFVNEYFI